MAEKRKDSRGRNLKKRRAVYVSVDAERKGKKRVRLDIGRIEGEGGGNTGGYQSGD